MLTMDTVFIMKQVCQRSPVILIIGLILAITAVITISHFQTIAPQGVCQKNIPAMAEEGAKINSEHSNHVFKRFQWVNKCE